MPLWVKLAHSLFVGVLVPVYWWHYGPANFLWFSDIAMLLVLLGLWLESPTLVSIAAVSVLGLELVWNLDFFVHLLSGVRLIGLADYMFDSTQPRYLRALSLFHVYLPPLMLWMLYRLEYEPRAWLAQTVIAWIVLPCSYWLTNPEDNVNWVFGLGKEPQQWMPPVLYLLLLMVLMPLVVYLPTHLVLGWWFGRA